MVHQLIVVWIYVQTKHKWYFKPATMPHYNDMHLIYKEYAGLFILSRDLSQYSN